MKKALAYISFMISLLVLVSSCNKNQETFDPVAQLEVEKPIIEAYVKKNYPNAVQHETTGIWYEVMESPEEANYKYPLKDTLNQKWIWTEGTINYKGKLISNGTIFDQTKDPAVGTELPLYMSLTSGQGSVITAWLMAFYPKKVTVESKEINLGMIFEKGAQEGAKFRIITPSYYAYGNRAAGSIPANSPLEFEIEVLKLRDFNPPK
ncbi:FKBP-type peptidyl-prolyl cis-trans isomerase [Sphingobacterium yanglingense]|uniref:Peptidyl-prolyl cis-trans isomerase n=1 Tax=Sphingobacterium yanglingense TaxID=1437280 RepID=A0A4R6W999_9SPHI|nr:FKBP-type peptidyl-prolyl cis-trans isomerase [Sphingobacterium yanglingense]TDQ75745.1 FKBP-type peptidyl-prolyl cis-trans isomerase FkpA [Sphingobacterium yanglingense]